VAAAPGTVAAEPVLDGFRELLVLSRRQRLAVALHRWSHSLPGATEQEQAVCAWLADTVPECAEIAAVPAPTLLTYLLGCMHQASSAAALLRMDPEALLEAPRHADVATAAARRATALLAKAGKEPEQTIAAVTERLAAQRGAENYELSGDTGLDAVAGGRLDAVSVILVAQTVLREAGK
jgi:hypothetical protein